MYNQIIIIKNLMNAHIPLNIHAIPQPVQRTCQVKKKLKALGMLTNNVVSEYQDFYETYFSTTFAKDRINI